MCVSVCVRVVTVGVFRRQFGLRKRWGPKGTRGSCYLFEGRKPPRRGEIPRGGLVLLLSQTTSRSGRGPRNIYSNVVVSTSVVGKTWSFTGKLPLADQEQGEPGVSSGLPWSTVNLSTPLSLPIDGCKSTTACRLRPQLRV